jgi:ATP-dependent DNA ligase I
LLFKLFPSKQLTGYSELPSYDVIIPAMVEHGIQNLREHCKLRPGVPLKPMLAKPTKAITEVLDRFEGQTFTCEYKYDGERAQIHYVAKDTDEELSQSAIGATKEVGKGVAAIFSRNSEDLSKKYPDVLAKLPTWVKEDTKSFVLDCESVAWDVEEKKVLPFQQLMTRKKKDVKVEDVKVKVCVFAFDLLYLNGEAVVEKPLRERRDLLHKAFQPVEGEFAYATSMDGQELDEIQTFLDESVKASCEGLMVKMLDGEESGYEPSKRSRNWLKVGSSISISFAIIALTPALDQERLPRGHRRLSRPGRPRRLPRQGQAHIRLRCVPAGVLQPGHRHVRNSVQHRHGVQRGRARGAARRALADRHRPPQALLRAQLWRAAPA